MTTADCGHENLPGARFCSSCGFPLERLSCASCSAELPPKARFCSECGRPVTEASAQAGPARETEGELRHLTVLFCDLVGSTELAAQLDPEELREVLDAYHDVGSGAIARHRGHVAQFLGDGILAYFGYPRVYEDSAEQAILAGLAIQRGLEALNVERRPSGGKAIAARVGIHTGRVVVGEVGSGERRETLALGNTTNVAARVQGAAEPGEVLMTAGTQRLVANLFEVEEAGDHALKGIETPLTLYRAIRPLDASAAMPRALVPFVGRGPELAALVARWEQACTGRGQVLLVSGEPGIGKSRLLQRFQLEMADKAHQWAASGSSRNAQHTPFGTIARLIESSFGWSGDAPAAERLGAIEQGLRTADLDPTEGTPLIAELLGIPTGDRYPPLLTTPAQQRVAVMDLLVKWLYRSARDQPMVLVIEDLHWADPSTLETLERFVELVASAPILLLLTARPEFRVPWPLRGHHGVLTLSRLGAAEVRELMLGFSEHHGLSDAVLSGMVARSDGVPLFAEELARTMRERLDQATALDEIPETLQDSLSARLDRLGPAREVAQLAAVIGRDFSYVLLRDVTGLADPALEAALSEIGRAEIFDARGMPPAATYAFRHALIQQAAYDSLLKKRRRDLHRRVAETLRDRFAEQAEAQPEQMAHHWAAAGEAAQAVSAWRQAGQRALARGAYSETIALHEMAIEALLELPETPERAREELDLQIQLSSAIQMGRAMASEEAAPALARARELVEQAGEPAERIAVLAGMFTSAFARLDLAGVSELSQQMERVAEESGEPALLRKAYTARAGALGNLQDLEAARSYAMRSLDLADAAPPDDLVQLQSLLYAGLPAAQLGYIEEARAYARELVSYAEARSNPVLLILATHSATPIVTWLRDLDWIDELIGKVGAALEGIEMPFFRAGNELFAGWAEVMRGRSEQGMPRLRSALEDYVRQGQRLGLTHYLSLLAEAQLVAGQVQEGLATAENALAALHESYWQNTEALRLRAALLAQSGAEPKRVEQEYRQAIAQGHRSGTRLLELRAANSLALHLVSLDRSDEAREILAPLYGSFSDGFDIPDLRLASGLLERISGAAS